MLVSATISCNPLAGAFYNSRFDILGNEAEERLKEHVALLACLAQVAAYRLGPMAPGKWSDTQHERVE